MCGIIACYSVLNSNNIILEGLLQLKNRGYDSVGIAGLDKAIDDYRIEKFGSNSGDDCYDKITFAKDRFIDNKILIAHTRWATHGPKTDINAHPHKCMNNEFILVHNGIIENYVSLKTMLEKEGYIFVSDTDTEVIVQLISFLYSKGTSIEDSILELNELLEGTWALVILCKTKPNTIYCTRKGSPLLVGINNMHNTVIVASEKSAFNNYISEYFILGNNDLCIITTTLSGDINIHTNKKYLRRTVSALQIQLTPDPYPHWTLKEIHEQVDSSKRAISMGGRILNNYEVKLGGLNEKYNELKTAENLVILGCGTSYFAGMHALYFFKDLCIFNNIQLFDGADFNSQDIPRRGRTAIIFISQSGETIDLHRCIKIARKHDTILMGVVNVVGSLISREVDCGCYLNAGREVGVASTKAYSSQVILLSMIAIWFAQIHNVNQEKREKYVANLKELPNDIKKTIDSCNDLEPIIEILKDKNNCFVLGKGKSESVAKEGSLKIKEISYIHSEGYSTSSLKHGPFALLDVNFPVIMIAPTNEYYSKSENAYEEIKSRHAPIIYITDNHNINDKKNVIRIINNSTYKDLLSVIPLQILAYKLAVIRGNNPDVPRNLAKVVTVE